MLQIILKNISNYYDRKNRWWLPLLCGFLYALPHPPFNGFLHPVFAPMPLFAVVSLIPLFFFATRKPRRKALVHSYTYCAAMTLGQSYWIGFTTADGLWIYIIIGVALISLVVGVFYFAAALTLRFFAKRLPNMYVAVFPAVWTLVEFSRTLTDIAFPWAFTGYSAAGILPIAQFSSFTGIWGLSYLAVLGNTVIWELLRAIKAKENIQQKWITLGVWAAMMAGIFVWGLFRMNTNPADGKSAKVALMQSYMDQFNWGAGSLDTAVTVSDSMIKIAAKEAPDVMIFPESALPCYLDKRPDMKYKVLTWTNSVKIPIVLGALHWEKSGKNTDKHDAYNTAFMAKDGKLTLYHKMQLVPFSEIMPFEARIPILSRINLGGASFKRGTEETLFRVNDSLEAAPYICYEIIFPSFVRKRLSESTNMLVNVTNDGWFGRSSGPFQHASMSQMRCIENGITLARAANSGISMFVDPYGRLIARTGLYTREILVRDVPTYRVMTFYSRFGDWFVAGCGVLTVVGFVLCFFNRKRMGEITNPLLVKEQTLVAAVKT